MDEVPEDDRTGQPERPAMDYEPTGVEAVDAVLAEVASVLDAPVGEHVAVFERAHEHLRRALDAQPTPGGDGPRGS
jgi:nitrogenase molybdenum-iron protein alpha/beta subunit